LSTYKHDARFRELQFLAQFEQKRWLKVHFPSDGGTYESDKQRQMVLWLIRHGMLNGPDVRSRTYSNAYTRNVGELAESMEQQDRIEMVRLIESLLNGEQVSLEMGHPGRLRLAELQEELKATRLRERFNILFDGRHVDRDLSVAILNSRPDAPVSLAYLDMNGLKAFNEDGDHATGDIAIKAFCTVVDKAVTGVGDAYRLGGDEVVVIMPETPLETARQRLRGALIAVGKEEVSVNGKPRRLSSACGLLSISSAEAQAEAELQRADHLQKKAKAASKIADGSRRSALCVQDEAVELL
jgi:diguanylate cyclase (GGDEF)-like protein